MKIIAYSMPMILAIILLTGCMSREEAAKHITVTLIESPEAQLNDWHPVPLTNTPTTPSNIQRFESPLGSIEISQTATNLTTITQPQVISHFNALKQNIEQQVSSSQSRLINPADDDSLQLAGNDFLHSTYRIRESDNKRQRIELFIAPIKQQLISIMVQMGDDADMHSYAALQTFLNQQISQYNNR